MKKQTCNHTKNNAGKMISRFVIASAFIFSFSASHAQTQASYSVSPLQVKYLGVVDNQPLFQVDLDNESNANSILSIRAEDGTLLYTEKIKAGKFSKRIKWDNQDASKTKISFTLASNKEKQTQVFEMNTTLREVRDVVITKL